MEGEENGGEKEGRGGEGKGEGEGTGIWTFSAHFCYPCGSVQQVIHDTSDP